MIELTVFDVGRGLAVLCVLPPTKKGYASIGIVDCFAGPGKREPLLNEITKRFGRKVTIEFLVLSHMHSDHFLGVGSLLDRFGSSIKVIADSGIDVVHIMAQEFPSDAPFDATARGDLLKLHRFKKKHRNRVLPLTSPGVSIYKDDDNDIVVRSIAPAVSMLEDVNAHLKAVVRRLIASDADHAPAAPRPHFDLNRTSSAVEIVHRGCRIVIGGDVLLPAWNSIRRHLPALHSDIFVLSHHGAGNGFPSRHWKKWIAKSTNAIVSGEGYNQPSTSVVKQVKEAGGRVFTTTRRGVLPRVKSLADFAISFHHRWPEGGPHRDNVHCTVDDVISVRGLEY